MTAEELAAYRERVTEKRKQTRERFRWWRWRRKWRRQQNRQQLLLLVWTLRSHANGDRIALLQWTPRSKGQDGQNACITLHAAFERVCLDPNVLETALVLVAMWDSTLTASPSRTKLTVYQHIDSSLTGSIVDLGGISDESYQLVLSIKWDVCTQNHPDNT